MHGDMIGAITTMTKEIGLDKAKSRCKFELCNEYP